MKDHDRPAGSARRAERSLGDRSARAAGGTRRPGLAFGRRWAHPAWVAALVAFALYLPSLEYDFVRDDHTLVVHNQQLREPGALAQVMSSDVYEAIGGRSGLWRPAVMFSYWLDARIGQWKPGWFHFVNVSAHAVVTALVVMLLLESGVGLGATWLAGLAFAALPLHHESVAWIAGRTDVLCALFFVLALWLDARARRAGRRTPGVLAVAALALALASKEVAVVFVAVVAVAHRLDRRAVRATFIWLLPYLIVTVLYLVFHLVSAGASTPAVSIDAEALMRRRWGAWAMLPGQIAFLWPWFPHSPERSLVLPGSLAAPSVLLGVVLQAACGFGLIALIARRQAAAMPLALFWLTLLPTFVMALANGFLAFAERLLYLPSVGVVWGVGLALSGLWRGTHKPLLRIASAASVAIWVVAGGIELVRTLPMWRSDATMYEAMVERDPRNAMAQVGWAEVLAGRGRFDQALAALEVAERLEPQLVEIHVSRAGIHMRRGQWQQVVASADAALAREPGRPEAERLRVGALLRLRRMEEALATLESMRARRPADPATASLYGQALLLLGRNAEAVEWLERSVRHIEDDPSSWFALGNALLLEGRNAKARDAFDRTVALDGRFYQGWLRLASACQLLGDTAGRDRALQQAATLPGARDGRAERMRRGFLERSVLDPSQGR